MGRQYPLVVKHEDEQLMFEIADYVDKRFRTFKKDLTNQNETTIMVLSCLSIAEELFTLKNKINQEPEHIEKINDVLKGLIKDIKSDFIEK
jgi:cell division protein ZapA